MISFGERIGTRTPENESTIEERVFVHQILQKSWHLMYDQAPPGLQAVTSMWNTFPQLQTQKSNIFMVNSVYITDL